ncbi:nuclear pore complex protein NUP98A-like [Macadamia integrifolia]|uniref:nuclear pore complex protein NUP98A-like n=1 Tax=Macadamia integrifolia TaxID=60698 RepID=UPI001C4E58CD|nr:nuclear pore complex protein NUP98A-like [Macadamia integrifolia]
MSRTATPMLRMSCGRPEVTNEDSDDSNAEVAEAAEGVDFDHDGRGVGLEKLVIDTEHKLVVLEREKEPQQQLRMFDSSKWNKNLGESSSNMPLSSSISDSPRFGLGASSTPAVIGNASPSLFSAPSMTGPKPISEGFGCNPFSLGNQFQTTQEASGNNLFGSKPSSGAFIQPATSQRPGLDASSSQAFGFATASAFGSTVTNPFVPSTPPSLFCGSLRIVLKCATCGGFDWAPHISQPHHPLFGCYRIVLKCDTCGGFDWVPHITQPHHPLFGSTQPLGGSSQPMFAVLKHQVLVLLHTFQQQHDQVLLLPAFRGQSGGAPDTHGKLMSISAVPTYNDKSHEELRLEEYKLGDKGGSDAAAPST